MGIPAHIGCEEPPLSCSLHCVGAQARRRSGWTSTGRASRCLGGGASSRAMASTSSPSPPSSTPCWTPVSLLRFPPPFFDMYTQILHPTPTPTLVPEEKLPLLCWQQGMKPLTASRTPPGTRCRSKDWLDRRDTEHRHAGLCALGRISGLWSIPSLSEAACAGHRISGAPRRRWYSAWGAGCCRR